MHFHFATHCFMPDAKVPGSPIRVSNAIWARDPVRRIPENVKADFLNAVETKLRHDAIHFGAENL
jgi:hypothetical protein